MSGVINLPGSWVLTNIDEVCDFHAGFGFPTEMQGAAGHALPFYKVKDVSVAWLAHSSILLETEHSLSYEDADRIKAKPVPEGTIVFAKIGEALRLNRRAIIPRPSLIDNNLMGIGAPPTRLATRYLYWFSIATKFDVDARASVVPSIRKSDVGNLPFPLPPLAEQTRIVAKLEELLSDLDAGVAELKAAQKKLGQYRQSLLKAAVEGALTAEWRAARTPLAPCGRGAGGEGYHGRAEALACSEPSSTVSTVSPSPQPLPHQEGGATTVDENWLQARARELRQAQTPQEQALWQHLRAKRFEGYKFRRQQPLGHYIVDFVCFGQKLIVELDGSQHANATQYDAQRDAWLKQQGFRVLRFWNNQWTAQPESVLEAIWLTLQQEPPLSSCSPLPNPSPSRGEGLETETGAALTPLSLDGIGAGGEGETGAQLLERILTERRARWEAKQLAKFVEQGKTPPKDWQKKYPEPVQPDTTDLPELPEGWVWASVEQLTEFVTSGSRGWADYYAGAGATFIRSQNINKDWLDLSDIAFVNPPTGSEGARTRVQKDDVLLTITGANVGKTARVEIQLEEAYVSQHVALIRMIDSSLSEFLHLYLSANSGGRGQLNKLAYGAGKPGLNLQQVGAVSMPLPSSSEIHALLEAVSVQWEAVAASEAAIVRALKQSTAQRQNILRAAFAGQLVPQDPSDEPASVLLERIRLERATQTANKKPRGRKAKEGV